MTPATPTSVMGGEVLELYEQMLAQGEDGIAADLLDAAIAVFARTGQPCMSVEDESSPASVPLVLGRYRVGSRADARGTSGDPDAVFRMQFAELRRRIGEPHSVDDACDKSRYEWVFVDPEGRVVTVYDWKSGGRSPSHWWLGCRPEHAEVRDEFLTALNAIELPRASHARSGPRPQTPQTVGIGDVFAADNAFWEVVERVGDRIRETVVVRKLDEEVVDGRVAPLRGQYQPGFFSKQTARVRRKGSGPSFIELADRSRATLWNSEPVRRTAK